MPTIVFKTRIRTTSESFTLDLVVSHHLVAGEPSATPLVLKNPPPQGVDIVLVSPLIITTTGMLNNRRISADSLKSSRIALHLVEYLKLNSGELGFEVVSDAHIAKDTGLLTFFCTASRPSRSLEVEWLYLKLVGFDMDYCWHETPSLNSPESQANSSLLNNVLTPFSSQLALPYFTGLNDVVERFVTFQMVKRYPRIFGAWSQQLDTEESFIPSLFNSLSNISRRSSDLVFQKSFEMRLKMLEKAMFTSLSDSENRLSGYLDSSSPSNFIKSQRALLENDETIFIHAIEQVYCLAMKRRKFKSTSHSLNFLRTADDTFCDQQPFLVGFEEEPHFGASDDEGGSSHVQVGLRLAQSCSKFSNLVLDREYAAIADNSGNTTSTWLLEDLFPSDFDPLDMQFGINQFRRSVLGNISRDVDSFSQVASCLDNVDIFASKAAGFPSVTADLGSSAYIPFTSPCTEGYRSHVLSEFRVECTSNDVFTALSDNVSNFTDDEYNCNCSDSSPSLVSAIANTFSFRQAATVEDVDSVDFVAMEF